MDIAALIERLLTATDAQGQIDALAVIDLDGAEAAMRQVATDLIATGNQDADTLGTLTAIADAIDIVTAERNRREGATAETEAAQVEAAEGIASIAERLAPAVETEVVEPEAAATAPEAPAEVPAPAAATPTEPVPAPETAATTPPVPAPAPAPVVEAPAPAPAPAPVVVPEPVAATTEPVPAPAPVARPSIDAMRQHIPADLIPASAPAAPQMRVMAGPDLTSYGVGQDIPDLEALADAMIDRRQQLGTGSRGVKDEKVRVAQFNWLGSLTQASADDPMKNWSLLQGAPKAFDTDGALVASGGLCPPAEVVYDFVKVNQPTELVQDFLPTLGLPRGSITYPDSPDIRDALAAPLAHEYTVANDEAGASKVTNVIPCPEYVTCEIGAEYHILQFGNLSTIAHPEWVRHWTGLATDAHAHLVSSKLISQMVTLSNAAVVVGPSGGATATILGLIGLAAADLRHDLKMGRTANLDVVLPSWTADAVRVDLIKSGSKTGLEALSITNAQVDSWIRALGVTPRYVTDWQDVSANSATGAGVWPASLKFLIYPPGTFVRGDMGMLNLGLVRDSALNETNDYNIFVETFEVACKPGIESRLYQHMLCVNGEFAAPANLLCSGVGPASS